MQETNDQHGLKRGPYRPPVNSYTKERTAHKAIESICAGMYCLRKEVCKLDHLHIPNHQTRECWHNAVWLTRAASIDGAHAVLPTVPCSRHAATAPGSHQKHGMTHLACASKAGNCRSPLTSVTKVETVEREPEKPVMTAGNNRWPA